MARVSALIVLVALAGCRTAEDDYEDFLARRQSDGGAEQVVQSTLQDLSGMWLANALLAGGLNLGLKIELTMDPTATPIAMHARMWLTTSDEKVDPPLIETDTIVEPDGRFELRASPLVLEKGSTPGLNVTVTADVTLHAATQSMTAWCGTATGRVSQPLSLDLMGSTFAARKLTNIIDLEDVPQACFPRAAPGAPMMIPKPASPDLSSVPSMLQDLSGSWLLTANLAGSVPLQLWAELHYLPSPMGGGSIDGALRRATDPVGSIALSTFSTTVDQDGRFEVWLPSLTTPTIQAAVLLVGATRSMDVICGKGAGQVQRPLELDLMGTTFAGQRWMPGTMVPDNAANACQ